MRRTRAATPRRSGHPHRGPRRRRAESRLRDAADDGDHAPLVQLLEQGVDPCAADEKQRCALHFACARGSRADVEALVEFGADPDQRDCNGNTPLHLAACAGHLGCVAALIKGGCKVDVRDGSGRTPLHYASSRLRLLQTYTRQSTTTRDRVVAEICEAGRRARADAVRSRALPGRAADASGSGADCGNAAGLYTAPAGGRLLERRV